MIWDKPLSRRVIDAAFICKAIDYRRKLERSDMSHRFATILCLLAITSSVTGCASSGFGVSKSKPFGKEGQWEPEVDETKSSDWRSTPSSLRKGKDKESSEDPIDKWLWSDESREISRNLGGRL